MLPSSLSQISRPSLLCPMGAAKPSAATRRSSYALRHAHGTPILVTERPWQRHVAVYARPDDSGAGVADKTVPTAPFKAKDVTDANWEDEVLKSPVPVFVDFWAPWCGPCRMIGPTIDELIDELGDKFKAVKLNTDKSPGIATEYGIRSIPTCMIFKDGQKVDTIIGAVKKPILKSSIEKFLT